MNSNTENVSSLENPRNLMNTSKAENTKKALGVGIFYLLGIIFSVAPWPAIVPAVLLGSGMSLLVYHFLGGITKDDRITWSVSQKAALQIGGASVILLSSSYWINSCLDKAKSENLVVEPEPKSLLVLNEKGESVEVKTRRGQEIPQRLKLYKGDLRNVNLSIQYIAGRIFVRPAENSNQNFFLGNIDNPSPDQTIPLTNFITQASEDDYFNPTLVSLRKAICAGAACPNSFAGFPLLLKADEKVKKNELNICVSNPDIAGAFASASSNSNSSLYISSLYIAPLKNSASTEFKEFKVSQVFNKQSVPRCSREKQKIIALVNLDDLKNWSTTPSKVINKTEMYATTALP